TTGLRARGDGLPARGRRDQRVSAPSKGYCRKRAVLARGRMLTSRRLETPVFPSIIVRPMPKRFVTLARVAAASAYLLIVLGAVVRISGSGMGCGDHWPLCNGHLFPPLDDIRTVIEWSHRLVAGVVSILVVALVALDWRRAWPALALLIVQILLGAVTVKTELKPVLVILHLATAMLLLAALIVAARPGPRSPLLLGLTFTT